MPAIVRLPLWFVPLILAVVNGFRSGHLAADPSDKRRSRIPVVLLLTYLGWALAAGWVQGDVKRGAASIVFSPVLFMQMISSMLATTAAGFMVGFGLRIRVKSGKEV